MCLAALMSRVMSDKTLLPRQVGISDGVGLGGYYVADVTDVADALLQK